MWKGLLVILVLGLVAIARGGIQRLEDVEIPAGGVFFDRFGMYSPEDSPLASPRPSLLEYRFEFTLPASRASALALSTHPLGEIVLIHSKELAGLGTGHHLFERKHYCCSEALYRAKKCGNLSSLIVSELAANSTVVKDMHPVPAETQHNYINGTQFGNRLHYAVVDKRHYLSSNNLTVDLEENYTGSYTAVLEQQLFVTSTGVYYVFIANCDTDYSSESVGPIMTNAILTSRNPYGYLDGEFVGNLFAFWIMGVLYFFLLATYGIFAILFRKNITRFQVAIGVVICISFLEQIMWASNNTHYNKVGEFVEEVNAIGAFLTALKETAIRFLLVLFAYGYMITRNDMERHVVGMTGASCVAYFIVSCGLEIILVKDEEGTPVPVLVRLFFEVLSSCINIFLVFWILIMLNRMLKNLNKAAQPQKFSMYKRLMGILVATMFVSGGLYLFQIILEANDAEDSFFQVWWLWEAYWEFFYFAVLLYLAIVWRPSSLNLRYAYSELISSDVTEENMEAFNEQSLPVDLGSSSSSSSSSSSEMETAPPPPGEM